MKKRGETIAWRQGERFFRARVRDVNGSIYLIDFVRSSNRNQKQWTLEQGPAQISKVMCDD